MHASARNRPQSRPAALAAALLAVGALSGSPAVGHHAFEVHYALEEDAMVHRSGVLRRFSPRSPHSFIVVAVTDGETVTDWVLEAPNRALLSRAGWPFDRLVEGVEVRFSGFPARNGEPAARLHHLELPDLSLCGYYCEVD